MSNEQVLEIPFNNISQRQCYEIIGCAGEVVANAFAAGVPTVAVKAGMRRDPGSGVEEFVLGAVDNDSICLRTESLGDITAGRPPADFNPFKMTVWPLVAAGLKPPTVQQILFSVIDRIPAYAQLASPGLYSLELAPNSEYFLLRNWVAQMFGLILVRGGFQQWFGLCQSVENGKRRFFLMFSRVPQLSAKDLEKITNGESCYRPTWMLSDVIAGVHKSDKPFDKMEVV